MELTGYGSPAKYDERDVGAGLGERRGGRRADAPTRLPVTNATLSSRRNTRALYSSVIVAAVSTDAAERLEGDFTLSLRVEVPADRAGAAGGLAAKFDPATRTGFSLSAISSAGGYNGPGDELRLSFGIDAGTEPRWFDRGRPSPTSNYVSNSLTVFDGALHAATSDAPAAADRGHVYRHLGEHRVAGPRPGRARGRARRRPADRAPRRALRRHLELRLDARPRRGSRRLPRVPVRRRPASGRTAASRATRGASSASPRTAATCSRWATTPRCTSTAAGPVGAGAALRHVRAPGERPRRPPGARHAAAGHGARVRRHRLGRPRQPDRRPGPVRRDPHARHLPRRAARGHVAARPRRPLGRRPPALAADRPARRQHRGDGAERLQRQALQLDHPARRGVPLRARRLLDEPAPALRPARLAAGPGAEHGHAGGLRAPPGVDARSPA